jgi:hypothetical protein
MSLQIDDMIEDLATQLSYRMAATLNALLDGDPSTMTPEQLEQWKKTFAHRAASLPQWRFCVPCQMRNNTARVHCPTCGSADTHPCEGLRLTPEQESFFVVIPYNEYVERETRYWGDSGWNTPGDQHE